MFGKNDRDILISKFASSAAHVKGTKLVSAEICTWIVPLDTPWRSFKPIPGLAGKVNVKCDLFADSSCDWEACNASSAS